MRLGYLGCDDSDPSIADIYHGNRCSSMEEALNHPPAGQGIDIIDITRYPGANSLPMPPMSRSMLRPAPEHQGHNCHSCHQAHNKPHDLSTQEVYFLIAAVNPETYRQLNGWR